MRGVTHIAGLVSMVLAISGCTTARLPLCADLARTTSGPAQGGAVIGQYVLDNAAQLHVTLRPISPFAVMASGRRDRVKRFELDYPHMVCAFSPRHVTVPRDTYLQCMGHVLDWIRIIQSGSPQNLMVRETLYEATCASGAPMAAR